MGQSSSQILCDGPSSIKPDEFVLSIDAKAFEFQMLSTGKKDIRVARLHLNGAWASSEEYLENPYEDPFVRIQGHNETSAKLDVLQDSKVQFLYARERPKSILCFKGHMPILYMRLVLKRQDLAVGTYKIPDDSLLLTPTGILVINLPRSNDVKPTLSQLLEKPTDPSLLFMATLPLKKD